MGAVNGLGLWTLYLREVRRFLNVYTQTVAAPVVTTLLFLAIFTLALGRSVDTVMGVPFSQFLAPGLIMMAIAQNAFANTSSSIVIAKVQGNIVDVLMPPLSALELTLGFVGGGITRGLVVGLAVGLAMLPFAPIRIEALWALPVFAIHAALLLSLLGVLGGILAERFDHIAAFTNFVITPFSFLSGTFYSAERLPAFWQGVAHANPFFYMIDGFRYGFLGTSDSSPLLGFAVLTAVNLALFLLVLSLFRSGYRLKA